jgi:hypothetical protein
MLELDPGHRYLLDILDGPPDEKVVKEYVKREGPNYPGNVGHHSGPTLQENWRADIARLQHVNSQIPCNETLAAISLLRQAMFLLESRAKRTHGQVLPCVDLDTIEHYPTCKTCGHILCTIHQGAL